tara:strand:- start:25 stop:948 length:924 start_codon:yes stop_codon:yes gene_type:complete
MNININNDIFEYIMKNIKLYTVPNQNKIGKIQYEIPKKNRIIAIGDIHSDFLSLYECLLKSKVINKYGEWIGKNTYVVQLGDILDGGGRGNHFNDFIGEEFFIIEYLNYLDIQARKSSGRVIRILGNHELGNIFYPNGRYLTETSINMFQSFEKRVESLKPGNYGSNRLIHNTAVVLRIGDWIFVHGGLLPSHIQNNTITDINNKFYDLFITKTSSNDSDKLFFNDDSIFYNRLYSDDRNNDIARNSMNKLKRDINIKGMVVGHTIQNKINNKNDVWRIDVGLSKTFGINNKKQVLEILNNNQVNIL